MLTTTNTKKNGGVLFVTFYLKKSLPIILADRLEEEFQHQLNVIPDNVYNRESLVDLTRRKYFKKIDDLLHALQSPNDALNNDNRFEQLCHYLEEQNQAELNVIAYSILSNHVHICIATNQNEISGILTDFSNDISLLLEGEDTYSEHVNVIPVLNREELSGMMQFIVNEPVEREMEETTFDWKGTFVRDKYFKLLKKKPQA